MQVPGTCSRFPNVPGDEERLSAELASPRTGCVEDMLAGVTETEPLQELR